MSEARFTKGPWRFDEYHDGVLDIVGQNMPNHRRYGVKGEWTLATVGHECDWDDPAAEARDRANARLIAAAPDGYGFADAFIEYVRRSDLDDLDFGRGLQDSGLIEQAQAFLAKARGVQP